MKGSTVCLNAPASKQKAQLLTAANTLGIKFVKKRNEHSENGTGEQETQKV